MKKISLNEGLKRWPVGKTTLYKLLNSGAIAAVRFGRRTFVDVESGDHYFASLPPYRVEKTSEEDQPNQPPASA